MTEVLMTLGDIRFSVADGAYEKLERELEIRVSKHERAAAPTARQVLGEDETIEIRGTVYAAFKGGIDRLDSFRAAARTYLPQMLTDGTGKVWGRFLIERVTEGASHHLPNGVPLKQEFTLRLGAYGEDSQ